MGGESITRAALGLSRFIGLGVQDLQDLQNTLPTPKFSTSTDFFWDTPWGNVPPHRLGVMTAVPPPKGYRQGLLGGSSKLQALAAKRKQKQDALKASQDATTDKAVALLDKLNVKDSRPSENKQTLTKYPTRKRSQTPEVKLVQENELESEPVPKRPVVEFPDLRAQPSMFGATLCGPAEPAETGEDGDVLPSFPLPYTTLEAFRKADPFANPSPDDVVRQAQARGAKRG